MYMYIHIFKNTLNTFTQRLINSGSDKKYPQQS